MAASQFYEVRCENCRTTFPPETKRCIHCGGPIGGGITSWRVGADSGAGAEGEESLPQSRARNVLWLVTAVLAVTMSLLRNCGQG